MPVVANFQRTKIPIHVYKFRRQRVKGVYCNFKKKDKENNAVDLLSSVEGDLLVRVGERVLIDRPSSLLILLPETYEVFPGFSKTFWVFWVFFQHYGH